MNYAVSFLYQSDDFEISVGTNHVYEAKNREEAMEKAATLQQLWITSHPITPKRKKILCSM